LFQPRSSSKLSSNRRFSFPLISPVVPPLSHISLVRIRTLIIVPRPPLAPCPLFRPLPRPVQLIHSAPPWPNRDHTSTRVKALS
jgi:hypothetical protein